jgi:hypothetical protein
MIPTHRPSHSNFLAGITFLLGLTSAVCAMTLVAGEVAKGKPALNVPAMNASECVALDAAVFGSSAGQASIKSAPTTWSSRSNVRWHARWATDARYVV